MIGFIKKNLFLIGILFAVLFFFQKTITAGLLPIPSDTIVGLYHPYLDMYAKISPAGVPFKNFLITDPVRQIIPWKNLVIDNFSNLQLPLWNPYEMAGKPLLANFQSGVFYPLNLLLFIKPLFVSWSVFIMIQPLLAGVFLYLYLKNLKLDNRASLLGAISFAFGGFSIAWLTWGNIVHTALWLPLILLSIDKIIGITKKKNIIWNWIFAFSLISSFFAGHLQIFFYVFIFSLAYLLFRWFESGREKKILSLFLILYSLFFILTIVQWIPTFQFINLSARFLDQNPLTTNGWFLPFQNLVQFVAPDFFGNPATLNYFGVWNYAEFVGYIGVVGLFLVFCSLISKKKETIFFLASIILSLIFALPTSLAKIPFDLSIPFLSSAQPTRLIFLITFSLSVLSAFGFNYLIEDRKVNRKLVFILGVLFVCLFLILWLITFGKIDLKITAENLLVAKRNLIFPSGIFAIGIILILGILYFKETMARTLLIILVLAISFYDLYRFGAKFTPFTPQEYFFPQTSIIKFLQKDKGIYRIAATDSRIFPPNFSTFYKIQSIEGYDPLYLNSYAELIAASERKNHSIEPPFGFNRIITPRNVESPIIDLLNVKYILSFSDLSSPKFERVFQEGQTKVYKNINALPRVFFVLRAVESNINQETANQMFTTNLSQTAFVANLNLLTNNLAIGKATIVYYSENSIKIETENTGDGFLVLTDAYYPTWKADVDGKLSQVYKTDYAFRGIFIPAGRHKVIFYDTLL